MNILIIAILLFPFTFHALDYKQLHYRNASISEKTALVQFAIAAHDTYKTRTASNMVAEEVFDIPLYTFTHGIVPVVYYNNELIGFATCKPSKKNLKHAELGHLFIKKEYQKQGVGTLLFNRIIDHARLHNIETLSWISDPDSKDFYLKKGAAIVHYEQNLLNPKVNVPVFIIEITAHKAQTTLKAVYDFWASDYKKLMAITNYCIINWIDEKKSFLPTGWQQVLDLGCADGTVGEHIKTYQPTYIFDGIDFSRNMVQACAKKSMYLYANAIQADLSNGIPQQLLKHKKYDIILATGCLEFIQNHNRLFEQIYTILNNSGQFWLTLAVNNEAENIALDTPLITYTQQEAQELLKKHCFSIVDFTVNPCAYQQRSTQKPCAYFMIIAQKESSMVICLT